MAPRFLALAGVLAAIGVGMGAFGAHVLEPRLSPRMLSIFQTGVHYHLVHALGLLGAGLLLLHRPSAPLRLAAWLFVAGIALFSGSLYVLALSGVRWLGAITPLGGTAFLAGWLLLAYAAWHVNKS